MFMIPIIEGPCDWAVGDDANGGGRVVPFESRHDVYWDDDGYERVCGYCARLSAPGYMDRTDDVGPFTDPVEAATVLAELYANCELTRDEFDTWAAFLNAVGIAPDSEDEHRLIGRRDECID